VRDGLRALIAADPGIEGENPDARILVVAVFGEDERVFAVGKAGALGYPLKDSSPQILLQGIGDVSRGASSLHPVIARKLIQELNRPSGFRPAEEPLTEVEVVSLVARGPHTWRKPWDSQTTGRALWRWSPTLNLVSF
jgi:NarL family two-component system response regulator LiaR